MAKTTLLSTFAKLMRTNKRNISIKLVAIVLVAVIAMLTFNKSTNLHSHQLDDGSVVSHAHPYNKNQDSSPIKQHKHTLKQLLILEHFEILLLSFIVALTLLLRTSLFKQNTGEQIHVSQLHIEHALGRAPPIFI